MRVLILKAESGPNYYPCVKTTFNGQNQKLRARLSSAKTSPATASHFTIEVKQRLSRFFTRQGRNYKNQNAVQQCTELSKQLNKLSSLLFHSSSHYQTHSTVFLFIDRYIF